jgi:hypothetical protein
MYKDKEEIFRMNLAVYPHVPQTPDSFKILQPLSNKTNQIFMKTTNKGIIYLAD